MNMNMDVKAVVKPNNRLSERRGCGSFTLNVDSITSTSNRSESNDYHEQTPMSNSGDNGLVDEEKRNKRPLTSSVITEKMSNSYFRLLQQQDGADTNNIVTVEELSRESAPSGFSPASSPSSNYRTPLPGCSPRWPHTHYHGTIFSFSTFPSSSVSPSTSYQRRRLFRPFASARLFTNSHYIASRRLSTVVEAPVVDTFIEEESDPFDKCAGFASVQPVRPLVDNTSLNVKSPTVEEGGRLVLNQPQHPLDLLNPPRERHCDRIVVSCSGNASCSANHQKKTDVSVGEFGRVLNVFDSSSYYHHQRTTHSSDNNRTTGDFSTHRATHFVSLNCSIRSPLPGLSHEKLKLISNVRYSSFRSESSQNEFKVNNDDLSECNRGTSSPPASNNTSYSNTMDEDHLSVITPTECGEASAPRELSVPACQSVSKQEAVQSESILEAFSGPTLTARQFKTCHNHSPSLHGETGSKPVGNGKGATSSTLDLPNSVDSVEGSSPADVFCLPNRPTRARSPKIGNVNCDSSVETVRDGRTLSEGRPASDSCTSRSPCPSGMRGLNDVKVERLVPLSIPNQLPPIPIAPPRHPRTRSERKKSPRFKKDSATSTSDLTLPPPTSISSANSQNRSPSERGPSREATSTEKASDPVGDKPSTSESNSSVADNVQKLKECSSILGSNSPTDHSPQQRTENIFSSSNSHQPYSIQGVMSNDDIFDEVQLSVSKLNPRIMVGTYQQRTIPFRSASFSQIDVGADGTYNRRPRTSITLKPVTYSIGKDHSRYPNLQHCASLPRRLKINDQRCPDEESHQPPFLTESPTEQHSLIAGSVSAEPPTESQPVNPPQVNHSILNDTRAFGCEEDRHLIAAEEQPGSVASLEQQMSRMRSPVSDNENETTPTSFSTEIVSNQSVESCSSIESRPKQILLPMESPNHQQEARVSPQSDGNRTKLKEDAAIPVEGNTQSNIYETTEVSVSAEICLSLLPNANSTNATHCLGQDDNVDDVESPPSSKPLPVLDLLELNNHLLRLRAATRDSPLDHLDDVGITNEFDPQSQMLSHVIENFDSPSSDVFVDHESSERDTSDWIPAIECSNHTFGSSNTSTITTLSSESATTIRDMPNKRSPRQGKRYSKRRRHSSSLTSTNSSAGNTPEVRQKSGKGRSLTFPIVWPTNTSFPLSPEGNQDSRDQSIANGCSSTGMEKLQNSTSFSDCLPPADSKPFITTPLDVDIVEDRPVLLDSIDPVGHSSVDNTFLIENDHYHSIDSDCPDSFAFLKGSPLPSEGEIDNNQDCIPLKARNLISKSISASSDETQTKAVNQRVTVSLSVTLEPDEGLDTGQNLPSSNNMATISPYCSSDLDSVLNLSPEKIQRSPVSPRRYGLKRRPLRGPYGEMLEAEMNKSEFGKMYSKRNEDLNFLRDLNPRVNREAKSSSPRPLSPKGSNGATHPMSDEPSTSNWTNISTNVRSNSVTLPASHSLDDSQLKIGYTSAVVPVEIPGSPPHPRYHLSKRQTTPNFQYEYSDNDLEIKNADVDIKRISDSTPQSHEVGESNKTSFPLTMANDSIHGSSVAASSHQSSHHHQRTSSSPCQLVFSEGGFQSEDEPELLELTSLHSLLNTANQTNLESTNTNILSDPRQGSVKRQRDTRTHAIGELYDTERSYVESLQILVTKYLKPLKSAEYSGLVESNLVDEIFFQIPTILGHHEVFFEELRKRLEQWDSKQCVGGVFLETLTKPSVIETYTTYINHWKQAKEAIKSACLAKSAFSKFLEATAREHKGKLALDSLLIMPVQRIPRYELLIKMLLKHTSKDHPDHMLLLEAQKEVHELAVKINCVEREAYGVEQQQATQRELESLVEGLGAGNLATPERIFIRHDCVTIPSALGTRKERGFFLFSDLLVITSVKRRNTAIRKASSYSTSIAGTLEANKFKLLMRVPLDDLEVTKNKEDSSKRSTKEFEHLEEDLILLNQITELASTLHATHFSLDEAIKEIQQGLQRQLNDKHILSTDSQLATIDLAISTQDGTEVLSVTFVSAEKRASWEDSFTETKLRYRAMSPERRPPPEFFMPLPIRKTRAGLQFTCAAPSAAWNGQHPNDVWVCNSDGYVGQVCILSLHPEPNVTSCNGVCNARITCIAAIPANPTSLEESINDSSTCKFKRDLRSDVFPSRAVSSLEVKSSICATFGLESDSSSESSSSEESGDEDFSTFNYHQSNSISNETSTTASASEDLDTPNQPTMWLGTEDGCILIYQCGENIRLKKNRTRIQQGATVLSIVYMENHVFASLANGDILIFGRTSNKGFWNINEPQCVSVGSIVGPVTRMLPVSGGLWCTSQNTVKILNITTFSVDDQFAVSSDSQKSVLSVTSNGLGVWVAMQNSAVIRLFHALTHECICDVNLAPAVNRMLSGCDDIIRQHKAACLRVTSMMVCHNLLWVGTSAGVILTIPIPHLTPTSSRLSSPPCVTGLSHGHTGHVRFLTCVEANRESHGLHTSSYVRHSLHQASGLKNNQTLADVISSSNNHLTRLLVISGGDGYEDFRHGGFSDSVGREDSTNHLLLWQV